MGCGGSEEQEAEQCFFDDELPPPVFRSVEQEKIDASPLLTFQINFENGKECKKQVRTLSRVRGLKRDLVRDELREVPADWATELLLVWTNPADSEQQVELENDHRWSELEILGIQTDAHLEVRGVEAAVKAAQAAGADPKIVEMTEDQASRIDKDLSEEELKALFEQFDGDGDGTIAVNELGSVFRDLSEALDDLSDEELQKWMNELDSDHNGRLDFNEFKVALAAGPTI